MAKDEKTTYIILGAVALIVVAVLLWFMTSAGPAPAVQSSANAQSADICTPQPGYSEQEWREHMSHHPDMYAECLKT